MFSLSFASSVSSPSPCWILGLANSLFVAPRASQALLSYEDASKTSQATVAIQPRVFYEDFKNYVLYAQDVIPGANGTAIWHHVFIADLTKPESPHIITANEATVLAGSSQTLRLDLAHGSRHDISTTDPGQYDISTFATTELPMQTGQQEEDSHLTRLDTPNAALALPELWRLAHGIGPPTLAPYLIELHYRFAYPTACLVLMLVGVPLGLSSKRGGKGSRLRRNSRPGLRLLLPLLGGHRLRPPGQVAARTRRLGSQHPLRRSPASSSSSRSRAAAPPSNSSPTSASAFTKLFDRLRRNTAAGDQLRAQHLGDGAIMQRVRRALRIRFPLILDEYVMGSFLRNFALVLISLVVLFIIFTFFELIGDILRYRTPLVTVGDYLLNLVPFILYSVTAALLARRRPHHLRRPQSQQRAHRHEGHRHQPLSHRRSRARSRHAALSGLLFVFDETYLPAANRRQEALLSDIKGKPAQTFLRPDRKWMSGQTSSSNGTQAEPTRIFYYQFFDPDKNVFANLTVFEFQPGTFNLTRRIFAAKRALGRQGQRLGLRKRLAAHLHRRESIASYQPFNISTFPEIHEQPGYFKKEDRQSAGDVLQRALQLHQRPEAKRL